MDAQWLVPQVQRSNLDYNSVVFFRNYAYRVMLQDGSMTLRYTPHHSYRPSTEKITPQYMEDSLCIIRLSV